MTRHRKPGRPRLDDDTRQTILDMVVETVRTVEKGPLVLPLRTLAEKADRSHNTLVHHFGSQAGLRAAVAGKGFDMLKIELETAEASSTTWLACLQSLARTYLRFGLTERNLFQVMYDSEVWKAAKGDDGSNEKASLGFQEMIGGRISGFTIFERAVAEAQGKGALRRGKPDRLARALTATVDGLLFQVLYEQVDSKDAPAILKIGLEGLRSPAKGPSNRARARSAG